MVWIRVRDNHIIKPTQDPSHRPHHLVYSLSTCLFWFMCTIYISYHFRKCHISWSSSSTTCVTPSWWRTRRSSFFSEEIF